VGGKKGEMTQTLYAHVNKRKKMTQTLYAHMNKRKKKLLLTTTTKKVGLTVKHFHCPEHLVTASHTPV
jgi:hypothetical protein